MTFTSFAKISWSSFFKSPGHVSGGSRGGDGGGTTYDFAKCSQELHENERIWTWGLALPKFYYVDPPLHVTIYNKVT